MTIMIGQRPATQRFAVEPDWYLFEDIPVGEVFFDRRGLPHRKTTAATATDLYDALQVDDHDLYQSVYDDWPYWRIPEAAAPAFQG